MSSLLLLQRLALLIEAEELEYHCCYLMEVGRFNRDACFVPGKACIRRIVTSDQLVGLRNFRASFFLGLDTVGSH